MKNLNEVIVEILNIVEYKEDKKKFAKEFIDLIKEKTFLNLYESLPKKEKDSFEKLKSKLPKDGVKKSLVEMVKRNYSLSQISEKIKEVAEETMTDFLNHLKSKLIPDQRDQLTNLSKEVAEAIKVAKL